MGFTTHRAGSHWFWSCHDSVKNVGFPTPSGGGLCADRRPARRPDSPASPAARGDASPADPAPQLRRRGGDRQFTEGPEVGSAGKELPGPRAKAPPSNPPSASRARDGPAAHPRRGRPGTPRPLPRRLGNTRRQAGQRAGLPSPGGHRPLREPRPRPAPGPVGGAAASTLTRACRPGRAAAPAAQTLRGSQWLAAGTNTWQSPISPPPVIF